MSINVVTKYAVNGFTFDTMKEAKLEEAKANFKKRLPDDSGVSNKEYVFLYADVVQDILRGYVTECDAIHNDSGSGVCEKNFVSGRYCQYCPDTWVSLIQSVDELISLSYMESAVKLVLACMGEKVAVGQCKDWVDARVNANAAYKTWSR